MTYRASARRLAGISFLAPLAGAALLALAVRGADAQGPDAVLSDFQRIGEYVVVVDGKEVPSAEIYQTEKAPAILVIASPLPSPVLLSPRGGTVETLNMMKVAKRPDGTIDLLADAVLAPQGRFQVLGEDVEFAVGGKKVRLKARPPLIGLANAGQLRAYSPSYVRGAAAYRPDGRAIAALKKSAAPVKVRVVFGTWCPHCKQYVPNMLKVEEQLRGSKISFEYVGIPRDFSGQDVKRLNVKEVPTGIVYVNGKEVGRLGRTEWEKPEAALSRILKVRATG